MKEVSGAFVDPSEVVDVTSLPSGTSYELLRRVGPFYTLVGIKGVVQRVVRFPEINVAIALVAEIKVEEDGKIVNYDRGRLSADVKRLVEERTPRPGHYPLVPGIRS